MGLLIYIDPVRHPWLYLGVAPLVGASFVILLTTEAVVLKWLLLGRVRAGTYPVHGEFYVRKWIVDQLLALSLELVAPLHATLYLAPWFRALGAKLGQFVELSTALSMTPDLLEMGDESTIADEVLLGPPRIEGGWMTLAATRLGRRAFIGNSGVVPAGAADGDGSLVGVLSLAPTKPGMMAITTSSSISVKALRRWRRANTLPREEQNALMRLPPCKGSKGMFDTITSPPSHFFSFRS